MKIILYEEDDGVFSPIEVIEDVAGITSRTKSNVSWNDGSMYGIKVPFIIVPDEVEVEYPMSSSIFNFDIPFQDDSNSLKRAVKVTMMRLIKSGDITREELEEMTGVFSEFETSVQYFKGDIIRYQGDVYKVIAKHISEVGSEPDRSPLLFDNLTANIE